MACTEQFTLPPFPGGDVEVTMTFPAEQVSYLLPWFNAERLPGETVDEFVQRQFLIPALGYRQRTLINECSTEKNSEAQALQEEAQAYSRSISQEAQDVYNDLVGD